MITYSQVGQDLFVLSFFKDGYKGFFMDIGCQLPDVINNTLLLEKKGWDGISFDIVNYSKEWEIRTTRFVCADVLNCDFNEFGVPKIIDYLSLDIDQFDGARYKALECIINFGFEFKIITIEHDVYMGYDKSERQPQRKLLKTLGYQLYCPDVTNMEVPFEDWWINPKYIKYK